jgi:hypothetical protein
MVCSSDLWKTTSVELQVHLRSRVISTGSIGRPYGSDRVVELVEATVDR